MSKYWGRDIGWVNLGSLGVGNPYSVVTRLTRIRSSGNESISYVGSNPWMRGGLHVRS